jgi:hypothetical protein
MRTRNTISRLIRHSCLFLEHRMELAYVAFVLTPSKPSYTIHTEPHYVHRNTCITVFLILHSLYVSASSSIFRTTNSSYPTKLNYSSKTTTLPCTKRCPLDHRLILILCSHAQTRFANVNFYITVVTNPTTQFVLHWDKNSLNFPLIPVWQHSWQ